RDTLIFVLRGTVQHQRSSRHLVCSEHKRGSQIPLILDSFDISTSDRNNRKDVGGHIPVTQGVCNRDSRTSSDCCRCSFIISDFYFLSQKRRSKRASGGQPGNSNHRAFSWNSLPWSSILCESQVRKS